MPGEADRWLRFAEEDLKICELALREGLYNQVCFHAQQCVEKSLKALFLSQGRMPPKVHAISKLLSLLTEHPFADLEDRLLLLDRFYTLTRYPDALPGLLPEGMPTREDGEEAFSVAREVLEAVREHLATDKGSP